MKRKLLPIIILLAVIAALASCAKTGAEQSARTDDGKIVFPDGKAEEETHGESGSVPESPEK